MKLKQDEYYTRKPDISMLKEMTESINEIPLPDIPDTPYIQLPPQEQALIRNNYQIYSEELLNIFKNSDKHYSSGKLEEELENRKHTFLGHKRKDTIEKEDSSVSLKKRKYEDDEEESIINMNKEDNVYLGDEEESGEENDFLMHQDNNSDDFGNFGLFD